MANVKKTMRPIQKGRKNSRGMATTLALFALLFQIGASYAKTVGFDGYKIYSAGSAPIPASGSFTFDPGSSIPYNDPFWGTQRYDFRVTNITITAPDIEPIIYEYESDNFRGQSVVSNPYGGYGAVVSIGYNPTLRPRVQGYNDAIDYGGAKLPRMPFLTPYNLAEFLVSANFNASIQYSGFLGMWSGFSAMDQPIVITKFHAGGLVLHNDNYNDIEILDAAEFRSGSEISTDPGVLGSRLSERRMQGVATDGVAELLLRVRTNRPGTVTFSIAGADGGATGDAAEDGELSSRTGANKGDTLAVQTETVGSGTGEFFAFARYRAPETFPRSGVTADLSVWQRTLRLRASFKPSDGSPLPAQPLDRSLTLARPPVVLIHGLADTSDTWQTFEDKLSARIPGVFVDAEDGDYRVNNRAHFSANEAVPVAAVIRARNAYRNMGLAAVQADVFGHSMGGVLSRIAAGADGYRADSNFGEGYFNKLVTIDSPHHGSPLANLVVGCRDTLVFRQKCEVLAGIDRPDQYGAYEDLETGNDPLSPLCLMRKQPTDVPAHVIVGDYSLPPVSDLANMTCLMNTAVPDPALPGLCKIWRLLKFFNVDTLFSTVFPLGGDLVVGVDSQRDGFPEFASQVSQFDHIHMTFADVPAALETDTVADQAVVLLNGAPGDAALFGAGFPTSPCPAAAASQRLAVSDVPMTAVVGGLRISSPTAGSTVQSGQILTVKVLPDAGVSLSTLMLTSPGDVQQDAAPPWEFALTIPESAVGPLNLVAVGKDAAGTFYSAETWLNVVPASALSTLSVSPANVVLNDAVLPQSLVVLGNYADSSQRDLSGARTGTVFVSQDPAVASVDANGQVTAKGNGSTTIAVTNGTATGTVVVVVQMETDLAISQTPVPSPVAPGAELAYGIAVTNIGQAAAREVRVEDRLPAGSAFVSATGDGWGCIEAGGVVSCYRDALAAGAAAPISLVVTAPPSCSLITNQLAVNADSPDGDVDNNVSVVATPCAIPTYALTVATGGTGSGTASGGGNYAAGAAVTLTAMAATGSTFTGWGPSPCAASFAMPTANLTCTATFTLNTYALTVSMAGTGSGTVVGDDTYAAGAPVTLTATASTGSTFTGWGPSPCAAGFVMPATDLTCIATFTANRYAVTALAGTNGRISPATQTVNHGATAAFTVTPNTGYLATATGCGGTLSGTTYTTGSITGACTVNAGFARAYPLTLTKAGTGSGRVTGTGIDCGSDCTETYAGGTSVTLTASPAGSSNFAGWRGACLGTGGCTVTIGAASSAMGVTANFSLKTYPITPTAVPAAGGTVTCTPNPVPHGASSSCTATPKTGYTLTAFSGACTGAACALTNITEAKGLTANFGLKTYPITATANPLVGGTVTCTPNPVTHGTNSTCTAAPNVGYTLSAFTGCTRSGTSSQCALTGVTSAKTVVATFSPAKYPITATPSPLAGGTVTCTPNPVTHGTNSSCTATAKTGYSLGAFSSGCTRIGTTSRCTLTGVTAPKTVTVTFVPNTYSITATASPLAGGMVTCTPNPVTHGSGTTCTAAPNVGYTLSAFTGCTRSGTSSQCALTSVTAAKTVIATFSAAKYPITATPSPLAGGTVTCTPNPVSHGAGSTCTARPKTGCAFAGFSGACTGASCLLNNVRAAQGVTANFTVLTLRIDDVSRVEGNLVTSAATFTVTLSAVGAGTVTVRYATANVEALAGSDYTAAGGTLAFLPGQTSKTLTVNLRGDTTVESDETFVVNLSAPAGATLLDKQGLGTIRNDD